MKFNSYISKFCLISLCILQINCQFIYDFKKSECGIIFSDVNYGGQKLTLYNGKTIADLSSVRLKGGGGQFDKLEKSDSWDKNVNSIQVTPGCKAFLCSDIHLTTNCEWVKENSSILAQESNKKISSLGCACQKPLCNTATCGDVEFRDIECGRGFFEPNCNSCGGKFLTIRAKSKEGIDNNYLITVDKLKSIHIRAGCNFTAYADNELGRIDDSHQTLSSAYDDNWNFKFKSYTCECEKNLKKISRPVIKDPNAPPMIVFPTKSSEFLKLSESYKEHNGILAALTSMRNNRSPKNAYILVIGLSGSGKSTTVNFLFDTQIAKTGSESSVTHSITEYIIPVSVPELGCSNCQLHVIDTPGFGDTSGPEADAKFLAGLEEYFQTHEELKEKLPNVVLIFSKFSDNRISGKSSSFVKTLRGIDIFRSKLFDEKYSNAVTVLTHFLSDAKNKKTTKATATRLSIFRDIIEEYTNFPKPIRIVVGENSVDDWDLAEINGYYELPNKEYYPQNLFEKIQEATGTRDPVGEAIIRTAFKRPEDFVIAERNFHLRNVSFARETHFLGLLSADNYNIQKTEVSNITSKVFYENIASDSRSKYPGSLEYTQRILNLKSIFTKDDIPRTHVETINFFKNIKLNPLIEELLKKSFDLTLPQFAISPLVGYGYNIITNKILDTSPFDTSQLDTTEIGYKLPKFLSCKLLSEPSDVFFWDVSRKEYLENRVKRLGFDSKIDTKLEGELLEGYNTQEDYENSKKVSALREFRIFELILNQSPDVSPVFFETVKKLPAYNSSDFSVVESWKLFFNKYGTHVIKSAYGGGGIEAKFKIKPNRKGDLVEFQKTVKEFFSFLNNIGIGQGLKSNDIDTSTVSYSLNFIGGDSKFYVKEFSKLSIDKISGVYDGFQESLAYRPTMLKSHMSIIPISSFFKRIDPSLTDKIIVAASDLFKANLKYSPPKEIPPLQRPEVVSIINSMRKNFIWEIEKLQESLNLTTQKVITFTKKFEEESAKEREEFAQKLKREEAKVKEAIALTCHYSEKDLEGKRLCVADMVSCLMVRMKEKIESVNTFNACVRFYQKADCSGNFVEFRSNITSNTNFPINVQPGTYFGVIRCEAA